MSSDQGNTFLGLPRRPPIEDASATAILAAIAGGLLTGDLGGVLLGGLAGGALASQRQPLEMAVREYFANNELAVIFFHRAPRAVKVTFSYHPSAFWTIESVMPDELLMPDGRNLTPEEIDDWLYGNLISNVLPQTLHQITSSAA